MKKMIMNKAKILLSFLIILSACQNLNSKRQNQKVSPKNNIKQEAPKSAKVLDVERKIKEREETIQDLKDQNRVVNAQRNKSSSSLVSGPIANSKNQVTISKAPQSLSNSKLDLSPTLNVIPKKDFELYQDLQGQFEKNNQIAFYRRVALFRKQFPQSHLMDEVLYLAGLMSLSNKNYAAAVKYFNEVIKKYPSSVKVSSASFAKGIAFKRMNLKDEARNVFASVKKKYPGSVEAIRADSELKIIKK